MNSHQEHKIGELVFSRIYGFGTITKKRKDSGKYNEYLIVWADLSRDWLTQENVNGYRNRLARMLEEQQGTNAIDNGSSL